MEQVKLDEMRWFQFADPEKTPAYAYDRNRKQKAFIDQVVAAVSKVEQLKREDTERRIDERLLELDFGSEERTKYDAAKLNLNSSNRQIGEGCIFLSTDWHGDLVVALGELVSSGAFSIVPNKYVCYDLNDYQIYESLTQEQIDSSGPFLLLPKLDPNPNYKGKFICLGDYIDRGDESEQTLALIGYVHKIKGELDIHFLSGNHENSNNGDFGLFIYRQRLAHLFEKGVLESGIIIEDHNGPEKFISFSHCELSKNCLPHMFEMYKYFMGHAEQYSNGEFADVNLKLKEIFAQKFGSFDALIKTKLESFDFDSEYDYDTLIAAGFTDVDFFRMKNLIIDIINSYLATGENKAGYDYDSLDCNPLIVSGSENAGPWFIAERNGLDCHFPSVTQYVGHTNDFYARQSNNTFFIDTANSHGSRSPFCHSSLASTILTPDGKKLQQFWQISREADHMPKLSEISKVTVNENGAIPHPGMNNLQNKIMIQNKKRETKAFDSLKRFLSYAGVPEMPQPEPSVVTPVVPPEPPALPTPSPSVPPKSPAQTEQTAPPTQPEPSAQTTQTKPPELPAPSPNEQPEQPVVTPASPDPSKNIIGAIVGVLGLAGTIAASVTIAILGTIAWPIALGVGVASVLIFGGVTAYNSYKIHKAKDSNQYTKLPDNSSVPVSTVPVPTIPVSEPQSEFSVLEFVPEPVPKMGTSVPVQKPNLVQE